MRISVHPLSNYKLTNTLVFLGVALIYFSLSPGTMDGMGYFAEEKTAGNQLLAIIGSWFHEQRSSQAVDWPRHGLIGVLFHLPFLALSGRVGGDRLLALEPILATSALVALVFIWASELSRSRFRGYLLALIAGFCTFFWPYAYIGLETLQSLGLFFAAFLALRPMKISWPTTLVFAIASAIAVSAKLNGAALIPAVGYLMWRRFFAAAPDVGDRRSAHIGHFVTTVAVVAFIFLVNAYCRSIFWEKLGGATGRLLPWLVADPIAPGLNFLSLLASPNKGLIVYAPITLLGLIALPYTFRNERPVAKCAGLILLGVAGSLCLLRSWSDETWGPRYLHCVIAPLILCVAVKWRSSFRWLRASLVTAALLGFFVSFLGVFPYYGTLHSSAIQTGQSTIEAFEGDPVWNHIRFNARLLRIWIGGASDPAFWSPKHTWFPPQRVSWPEIDLRPVAVPQAEVFRALNTGSREGQRAVGVAYLFSLCVGLVLLGYVTYRCSEKVSPETAAAQGGPEPYRHRRPT